jgi:hypothetical protein
VTDADAPKTPARNGAAGSIVERASAPAIDGLRATQPRAAEALARMLRDGALFEALSPKPLSKLAAELLETLAGRVGDAD